MEELAGGLKRPEVTGDEELVELGEVGDDHGAVDPSPDEALRGRGGGGGPGGGGLRVGGAAAGLAVADAVLHPLRYLVETFRQPVVVEPPGVEDAEAVPRRPQNVVLLQVLRPPVLPCNVEISNR